MNLELKHLCPYLPYGLKGMALNRIVTVDSIDLNSEMSIRWTAVEGNMTGGSGLQGFKPILRPLSDLYKHKEIHLRGLRVPFEEDNWGFIPYKELGWEKIGDNVGVFIETVKKEYVLVNVVDHINDYNKLLKWGFDVSNLIPEGLAININDLPVTVIHF